MVSFQDLVAFQQAEERLGCVTLQSYLEIIAKVNQKPGETLQKMEITYFKSEIKDKLKRRRKKYHQDNCYFH